jgi:hypothetical protein
MATTQYKQPVNVKMDAVGIVPKMRKDPDWTPMSGMSLDRSGAAKTSGIKIRGTGAATKGTMARGPMA